MAKAKSSIKLIFKQRAYFFLEVLTIYLGIFIFFLVLLIVPNLIVDTTSIAYSPLYFLVRALLIVAAIPTFLFVSNFAFEPQKKELILKEDISSSRKFLELFNISKKNYKYQLLYGILLLFLVFIPFDFFTYLFLPDLLEYSTIALNVYSPSSLNSYLLENYGIFIISVLIIQVCVSIYEESRDRGFLANRGSDYLHNMSAVIISSFSFGLGHFNYMFTPYAIDLPIIYPLIWFLQTFFVGIILAMIVIRKRWLFPAIFAHAVNNIITLHAVWNYLQGNDFFPIALFLYCPLLIISIILLILQFPRIKESLSIGFKEFGSYFKNNIKIKETTSHKIVRIIADFLFGAIIFLISIVLM
ncbi:MAG: CPBP family intramembrane glutamic endopeptidase [Candidatus Odinarchaeota archaeon]